MESMAIVVSFCLHHFMGEVKSADVGIEALKEKN